jgi:hypothetical protein
MATPTVLFTPDGDYLGTLPPGAPFPVAFPEADRLAAVERDALGIASLVVYRITRGRGPAD